MSMRVLFRHPVILKASSPLPVGNCASRCVLVKTYWVYYTFDDDSVVIWRVFHMRQDIASYTFFDLGKR